MEKESTRAGADVDDVTNARLSSSSSPAKERPELGEKARPGRRVSLEQPATPEAAAAAAAAKKPAKGDEDSRPRFWTKYPSSRLNEKKEGEGLDLEAERKVHEAHERREKVCHGPAGSAATSPGSGVAAAMAKLGRESLSMAD